LPEPQWTAARRRSRGNSRPDRLGGGGHHGSLREGTEVEEIEQRAAGTGQQFTKEIALPKITADCAQGQPDGVARRQIVRGHQPVHEEARGFAEGWQALLIEVGKQMKKVAQTKEQGLQSLAPR
jgi:hypothetical protein